MFVEKFLYSEIPIYFYVYEELKGRTFYNVIVFLSHLEIVKDVTKEILR